MTLPSSIGGPTTQQVAYFACDADMFTHWLRTGLDGQWEGSQPRWSTVGEAVADLEPGPVLSRYACIPVDRWTALLTNGPHGTDVGILPSYAARELGCRAVRAVRVDDDASYPARILEVYGPSGVPPLALERSVVAANDGGTWVFEASGIPFEFEDEAAYTRRVKATRFTGEMLHAYLLALQVPADVEPQWRTARLLEHRA